MWLVASLRITRDKIYFINAINSDPPRTRKSRWTLNNYGEMGDEYKDFAGTQNGGGGGGARPVYTTQWRRR